MSKLTSRKLRQLILKEFQKMEEDALRMTHDDPGRQSYTAAKQNACHECGYMMKEDESVCEQCGATHEIELNEGNCGCGPEPSSTFIASDLDNDFVPDSMEHHNFYISMKASILHSII